MDELPFVKGEIGVAGCESGDVVGCVQNESFCNSTLVPGVGKRGGPASPDDHAETTNSFGGESGDVVNDHCRLRFIAGYINPDF